MLTLPSVGWKAAAGPRERQAVIRRAGGGADISAGQDKDKPEGTEDPVQCLQESDSDIDWNTNGDPPVVRVMLEFENICKRPVSCKVTVQSGYRPTGAAKGDYSGWGVRDMLSFKFSLAPEETRRFLTTLFWDKPKGTTPQLRIPSVDPARHRELMECTFVEAEPAGR